MKKIFFLALFFVFMVTSCNLDDEPKKVYEILPVESVEITDAMVLNQINTIRITYKRPTTCHLFDGFYFESDNISETVAIYAVKLNEAICQDAYEEGPYEVEFNFTPVESKVYHFKFWLGKNIDGIDEFLEYNVEVN